MAENNLFAPSAMREQAADLRMGAVGQSGQKCGSPLACSSCGFPRTEASPEHIVTDGSGRKVCDRCWYHPALFFMGRQLEIHGSERAVLENEWRRYFKIPKGQITFSSVVPDYAAGVT